MSHYAISYESHFDRVTQTINYVKKLSSQRPKWCCVNYNAPNVGKQNKKRDVEKEHARGKKNQKWLAISRKRSKDRTENICHSHHLFSTISSLVLLIWKHKSKVRAFDSINSTSTASGPSILMSSDKRKMAG